MQAVFSDLEIIWWWGAGTFVHSFKFAADFDSPLEQVLAMSREFDLTHTWNRYVTESVILAEPSIFESTVYAASWLPFPFPHIDVVVAARGMDLADVSFWAVLGAACDDKLCLACCAVLFCMLCCAELCCAVRCYAAALCCGPVLCCAVQCITLILSGFQAHVSVLRFLLGICSLACRQSNRTAVQTVQQDCCSDCPTGTLNTDSENSRTQVALRVTMARLCNAPLHAVLMQPSALGP